MARRASSSPPLPRVLLTLGAFLLVAGAGFVTYRQTADPYRTVATLPVGEYLNNADSLRGNVYKLEGTVNRLIDWSQKGGHLVSVEDGTGEVVPLLVPPTVTGVNFERGQKYRFKIVIGQQGVVQVQEARKI